VGEIEDRRDGRAAEQRQIAGQQDERAGDERRSQDHEQRREESSDPPLVEPRIGEAARVDLALDDRRDQEARDDEEDVDADEAAGERAEVEVVEEDREDGDGAKPIYIGAVVHRSGGSPWFRFDPRSRSGPSAPTRAAANAML